MILLAQSATYPDSAYNLAVAFQGESACEDHDLAIVRSMNSEKLSAGLRVGGQVFRSDIKGAGGESFFDRNIDASYPGAIHPHVRDQVPALIGHRNVHRLANL